MNMEFGKKINNVPLIKSIFWGVVAGGITLLFQYELSIAIGVALLVMLLISLGYYPLYLKKLYGAWSISKTKVYYFDMDNYLDCVKLIFMPSKRKFKEILLQSITSARVRQNNNQITSSSIFGIWYLPELFMPWLRPKYLVEITTMTGEIIELDLSWDKMWGKDDADEKIGEAIGILNAK
ncbi:hypothetical protein FEZ51_05565 [Pediococcus stilesii]|uniref:Uncharacterized protein n=1 Tax=Pediococcus stilesii TaxID=331679 RepID=A0A5R9BVZ9_9LACO|nr:hypothetical protein [Pediococcus stilesii]TLQ04270.1 hypothetical protein FEZ51_05565 [Pediococcus stilesii]